MRFAARYYRNKEGRPWSAAGREWIPRDFWGPMNGWKWWPVESSALCDPCAAKANTITEHVANPTKAAKHAATGCKGLDLRAIIMTLLDLPRREGKTFNTAALSVATICKEFNKSFTYLASAEDQSATLFLENWEKPIRQNRKLDKECRIVGNRIEVARTKSFFEFVATSYASITGRGRTHIVIDEARDVPARVALALIPSVFDQGGYDCPNGCVRLGPDVEKKRCPVCRANLFRWYGRIVIMSSRGILDGGDGDWFPLLVDHLTEHPHPNVHVYRTTESTNPSVSKESKRMIEETMGAIPELAAFVDVEINNVSRRKGEDFVSRSQIRGAVNKSLVNQMGSARRTVGFLDTSSTKDLTSIVMVEEGAVDDDAPKPWQRLVTNHIKYWDPRKDFEALVIDDKEIERYLLDLLPGFPALQGFWIDVRGQKGGSGWAQLLVTRLQRKQELGRAARRIFAFHGKEAERDAGWDIFEDRIVKRTIDLMNVPLLEKELLGVQSVMANGKRKVVDRNRRRSHAEIAEGYAALCYLVQQMIIAGPPASLTRVDKRTTAADILEALQRPGLSGLRGEDDF